MPNDDTIWTRAITVPWVRIAIAPNAVVMDFLRGAIQALAFVAVGKAFGLI